MKCTKCGSEVKAGAFCSSCGNKLFQNQFIASGTKLQSNDFTKFDYSKKNVIAQCMFAVIYGIYLIAAIICYFFAKFNVHIRVSRWQYIAFDDDFMGAFFFVAVMMVICIAVSVIRCVVFRKVCLCVYSHKVTGVSAKNLYFATESFEIQYSEIIHVKQKGNLITIETGTKVYKCAVQDAQKAYEMILTAKNS